jgi:hypothetical protein
MEFDLMWILKIQMSHSCVFYELEVIVDEIREVTGMLPQLHFWMLVYIEFFILVGVSIVGGTDLLHQKMVLEVQELFTRRL